MGEATGLHRVAAVRPFARVEAGLAPARGSVRKPFLRRCDRGRAVHAERVGGMCGAGGRRRIADLDAELADQPGQSAGPALADGAEPPLPVPAVELAEHQRGHRLHVGDLECHDRPVDGVHGDRQVVDVAEAARVHRAGDDDAIDVRFGAGQRHAQPRGARRGCLVEGDRLGDVPRRVVEHQVPVGADSARRVQQQGVRVHRVLRSP